MCPRGVAKFSWNSPLGARISTNIFATGTLRGRGAEYLGHQVVPPAPISVKPRGVPAEVWAPGCRGHFPTACSTLPRDGAARAQGTGLLKNNYTLMLDVENPGYRPNGTNLWQFYTRVANENGTKYVDANRSLSGFGLSELVPLRTDEGAAPRAATISASAVLALSAVVLLLAPPASGEEER